MEEIQKDAVQGTTRRTLVKTAAWAAPVVAVAAAAPMAAATTEPEEAVSIGGTATSPRVGNNGHARAFGLDDNGEEGVFPDGQTFTIEADFDFGAAVTSVVGGSITPDDPGKWLIVPADGTVTAVRVNFNSTTAGEYSLISNGPVDPGRTYNGAVLA